MTKIYNLKNRLTLVITCLMIALSINVNAQLTGTKNIPGDYATLALAIGDLNTQGVGPGGVILNLLAGNSETAPAGGYSITTLTGTAADPIVIQGNGNTITASNALVAGALNDAIFKIIGADYVTITGFTMQENAANTVTAAATNNMTEWGIALLYATTTNGAQNITIQSNAISLDRTYQNTFGIYSNSTHSATTIATSATATTTAGSNSGLIIYANAISNVNIGILVVGPTAAADHNDGLDIGGTAGVTGNTITNYGTTGTFSAYANVSGTVNGILIRNTKNFNVSYNAITSSVGGTTAGTLRGVFVPAFTNAPTGTITNTINNNSVSLQSGVLAGGILGIVNEGTTVNATTTLNISGNNFSNFGHTIAGASGAVTFISNAGAALNQNINGNIFTNISLSTTGSTTFITNNVSLPAGGIQNVNNNSIVTGFNKTGAGGTVTFFTSNASSVSGTTVNNNNNNFSNVTVTGATAIAGWSNTDGGSPTKTVNNNIFNNITGGTNSITILNLNFGINSAFGNTISNITGAGNVTGIFRGASGTTGDIMSNTIFALSSTGASVVNAISYAAPSGGSLSNNKIYNIQSNNAAGTVNGILVSGGNPVNVFNNLVGDLRAPATSSTTDAIRGISVTGGSTINVYYNTVMLNATSTGANFSSSALNASTTPTLDLRNNILINNSTPMGTGLSIAYRRSSATLTTYTTSSNNNIFYAGTPGVANLIFFDGTNADQTLAAFQARVAPTRDASSRTENVSFISTSGASASFLHVNTATPTFAESGGVNIATFTTDYDADIRQGNAGYTGTGTAPDIGADEFEGTPVPMCAGTPAAGTITGLASVCSGTGTTLNLTRGSTDPGVTYQLGASSTAGGPYTNMGTTMSQATGNLTATTYYVVVSTCSFSGLTATTAEFAVNVNANPVVSVSPSSATYCFSGGAAVALTASNANTYSWSPAAGLSSTTGTSVNASPAVATTYTVTGTDLNGCIGTATTVITVNEIPSIASVTATPSSVCSGGNSQLQVDAATTSAYTVQSRTFVAEIPESTATNIFTTGDDAVSASIAIPFSFTFFEQAYTNLFVYTNGFVQLGTSSGSTNVYGAVIPAAGAPNNIIAGVWDDLNVIGAGSPAVRYFTNGTAPNRTFIIEYTALKFYNAASNNGNVSFQIKLRESSNVVEVHVSNAQDPTPSNHFIGIENATGTAGYFPAGRNPFTSDIVTSEAWAFIPSGGTLTYNWSPPAFLSSTTIANPMANSVTATTTYTVMVSNGSCSSTGSVTITSGSALSSSANITPAASVCTGTTVTLNSVPSGGGAPYTYAWSGPAGFSSILQNPSFTATAATAGTYTITVTDNCSATSTSTVTLTVNALPSVSVTPASALYCNPGTAVALAASGSATSYSWLPATGLSGTTGSSVNASPGTSTTYTVTGTDGNGCMNTATAVITSAPAVNMGTVTASPSAVCAGGSSNLLAAASFPTPTYCAATTTSTSFEKISNVTFGTINNTSTSNVGYENFTAMNTNAQAGVAIPISMGISAAYATDDRVHVWIDMNKDGVFADPAENVLNLAISTFCPTCSGTATTINGTITIPVTATNGATRMRIRLQDQSAGVPNSTPCGTTSFGQVEDYTVNITDATADNSIAYMWSPSTYLSNTTIPNPIASAITGNITYTVTATSTSGCSATGSTSITANPLPSVMAMSTASTVCSGSSVTLSGMGSATSYTWDNGVTDGVAFNPTSTATYIVTGTDANGCTNTASTTVTVNALPTVAAASNATNDEICAGSSVTLTGSGASTYTWSGSVMDGMAFSPAMTDTYTVTGTDANGCMNTATITVTVNTLPTVTAASDATNDEVCTGSSVTLTGSGASTYTWSGSVMDGMAFTPAMTDTYTVTGTDANGCMNTATITVTVNALPTVTAASDATNDEVCAGSSVTLTGSGASTYTWSGSVMDGMAFTPAMTDTYTVTGTDANGCMNTATITVTVNALPTVTAASDATNDEVCTGSSVTLTGSGAATYTWSGSVMDGIAFTPAMTDTYTVTGTDANGCMNTATITVTVNAFPTVTATSDAINDEVCAGSSVTLTGGGATSYTWTGSVMDGIAFTPAMTDTYTVTGTAGGCSATATITITVNALPTVAIAPFMTPVCDNAMAFTLTNGTPIGGVYSGMGVSSGMFDPAVSGAGMFVITYTVTDSLTMCSNSDTTSITVDLCSGIATTTNGFQDLTVSPNPASAMINIAISNANFTQLTINIVDIQGKEVYNETDKNITADYNKQINIEKFAKGVYYIKMNTDNDSKVQKLIVH